MPSIGAVVGMVPDTVFETPLRACALCTAVIMISFFVTSSALEYIRRAPARTAIRRQRAERESRRETNRAFASKAATLATKDGADPLSLPVRKLAEAIRSGRFTSEEVVTAFCAAASRADDACNCVTESRFEDALASAREADALIAKVTRAKKGKGTLPPLLGVPFSVKESLAVRGWDSTLGVAKRCGKPYEESALVVRSLEDLGAIPIVHTNVPQTLLSFESANPVYGATSNPWNKDRVPGGSSGGEGAILAMDGSPFGIGSDIGGSIRMPAAFCGVVGIKPTRERISVVGGVSAIRGQEAVPGVLGPMGRTVDDLAVMLSSWCSEATYDEDRIPPKPFDGAKYEDRRPLKIGYFTHDGWADAHPAYVRAVEETVESLKRQGHTVERFDVPAWNPDAVTRRSAPVKCSDGHEHPHEPLASFMPPFFSLLTADGGETLLKELDAEPIQDNLKLSMRSIKLPGPIKYAVSAVLSLLGHARVAAIAGAMRRRSVAEYWALVNERNEFRARFLQSFRDADLDAVISPVQSLPPVPHGSTSDLTPSCSYTMLYNVLDWPAGVVPVARVSAADDARLSEIPIRDKLSRSSIRASRGAVGLPIAVQVATRPFDEETCLRVMSEIEEHSSFDRTDGPGVALQK